jgi:orotidine-5'-phosphate decarboxylase
MKTDLIVALDMPNAAEAEALVRRIGDAVEFYKVGLELFISDGPATLAMLRDQGKRIFLDLKLHDIPRTVGRSVASAGRFDVELLTLHASGGSAMIAAAAQAAGEARLEIKLLAVTVLTSLDDRDLNEIGFPRNAADQVDRLGRMAMEAGAHGLVCSPREVGRLRSELGGSPYLVTPGIRPAGGDSGDQKRTATPASAVRDGASAIVVGRPIVEAADPRAAALAILGEF